MNKKELKRRVKNIEEYSKIKHECTSSWDMEQYYRGREKLANNVLGWLDELDEPEKPVVPPFVADEIERYDCMLDMLSGEYFNNSQEEIDNDRLFLWIDENQDTLARAWLDGFLIEDDIEVWQPITGFYNEVSNLGRVRSVKHKAGNEKNYKSKILKPVVTNSGYVNVAIINKSEGKITKRLHRVVAEAFIPNPENKPEINHIDGNKENNEVSNLEWVTSKENKRHAWENDLQVSVKGSEKPLAKLKEEDIVSIRKEYREGCIQMELAEKYGVARQTISSIVNMKAWKHVAEEVSE